jgi:hypothetical protein
LGAPARLDKRVLHIRTPDTGSTVGSALNPSSETLAIGTLCRESRAGSTLDRRTLRSRQLKPGAKAVGLATRRGICYVTQARLCMVRWERLSEPYRLCWRHSSSEITRQVYLHALPEDRWQRRSWKPVYLDPSWTQISAGENARFQNLSVQKKLLVGARRFELLTPCAQGRCATRLRYAPT